MNGPRPFLKIIRTGHSRTVVLLGPVAIKFPNCQTWRTFLKGLLGNGQEADLSRTRHPLLCPVLFCFPLGLFLVMRRARPLTVDEFVAMDIEEMDLDGIPAERKQDSWGWLDGRFVAVDYGTLTIIATDPGTRFIFKPG